MKKAVVFGGSGFLGSYIADELAARGYGVTIADLVDRPGRPTAQAFCPCDLLDQDGVAAAVAGADYVYNFAGLADIDESIHEPLETMRQNVLGNTVLLEACRRAGVGRYVYASSVYALSTRGSFYGISKLAAEKMTEEYHRRFGLPYSILRYGSLYGERADQHNGIYRMLRRAVETGRIEHWGDGEEVREYIHAVDAARLSVDVIESDDFANQHLVLTGVERLKQKDVLRMIQDIMDGQVEISFGNKSIEGHYEVTPYSFQPNRGRKLTANPYIDLGQGLVDCLQSIHRDGDDGD